ncbi:MAG: hypothetical protein OXH08_10200 [Gammaproteobacteria bacterium]|nr:hypothetical protein [Gammaproteobacteria bacterium]
MSGSTGSSARAPIASEHSRSVRGRQAAPAFSVRHTPPCAPPARITSMFSGWRTTADTRPVEMA